MSSTATTTSPAAEKLVIAITGSNGMVGQGVTRKALSDGHKVIALDMGPVSLLDLEDDHSGKYVYQQLDATDYEAYHKTVKEEGCTAIIHLAATFNKFGADGQLTSNVPSHVRLSVLCFWSYFPNYDPSCTAAPSARHHLRDQSPGTHPPG